MRGIFGNLEENDQLVVDVASRNFFIFGSKEGNIPLDVFSADKAFTVFFFETKSEKEAVVKRVSEILRGTGFEASFNGGEHDHFNFVLKRKHGRTGQSRSAFGRKVIVICQKEVERDLFVRRALFLLKVPEFRREKVIILDRVLTHSTISRLPTQNALFVYNHQDSFSALGDCNEAPGITLLENECSLVEKKPICQNEQPVFSGKDAYSRRIRQILKQFNNRKKG